MNPTTNIDRMRVSGGTSPTAINGDHALGATVNGRPSFELASGTDVKWSGTYWEIRSGSTARWRSSSPHGTLPSDVAAWASQGGSTGTIAVAAISRGADSLVGSASPGAPDAAAELIAAGGGGSPTAAAELIPAGGGGSPAAAAELLDTAASLGTQATATVNVAGGLTSGQTTTIAGLLYTALIPDNGAASRLFDDAAGLVEAINGLRAGVSAHPSVTASAVGTLVTLTAIARGAVGNALTLAKSGAALTISGATFTGGVTLPAPAEGLVGSGSPAAPAAAGRLLDGGAARFTTNNILSVTGTLSPNAAGLIGFVEIDIDGYATHSSNGKATAESDYPWTRLYSNIGDGLWVLEHHPSGDSGTWRNWNATLTSDVLDADDWAPAIFNPPTGTPAFALWPTPPASLVGSGSPPTPSAPGSIV